MGSAQPPKQDTDPRNFLVEIKDLRVRLDAAGHTRVAFFLACAEILATRLVHPSDVDAKGVPVDAGR